MDRTTAKLEAAHLRLLDASREHPSHAELAKCVPHLVGLVEARVPNATAVILRPDDVREMCLSLVLDVLEVQADIPRTRRARR